MSNGNTSPAPTVQVEVTPRIEEYEEATNVAGGQTLRLYWLLGALFAVVFGSSVLTGALAGNLGFALTSLVMLLLLPVVYFFLKFLMRQEIRKRYDAAVEMREPRTYVFSETGIECRAENCSGNHSWNTIVGASRTPNLLMLMTGQNAFFVIPFRCFKGAEERDQVIRLVRRKVRDCRL